MTRQIETILEILAEVRAAAGTSATLEAIRERRLAITKRIAERRQCRMESVRDTHLAQLKSVGIERVGQFDALVQKWLASGDEELRTVLLRRCKKDEDKHQIERFFSSSTAAREREDIGRPVVVALPGEVEYTSDLIEGATRRVFVNAYERSPRARAACIAHYRSVCMVCECDLGVMYGEIAEGFVHVHHLKPLSEIGEEYVVDPIKDLRPVCPNCHAVIHLGGECRTINEVRGLLRKPPLPAEL